ncbi:TSUP family transporter [Hymenobacter sp. ASUV-10]|uniref:Probable membrane transporter protein n=1 Tax=Hymenobacter aranciens TaxID=3063996 RepID=A0ABT9BE01_9BACT|nr:TSUP family transporter [Hymenobacter sp. ASUV-10]MDO7876479.1 TSUP family transporter [Hymenobacter sp. ASUV-10]
MSQPPISPTNALFPVFLKLEHLRVLLVGGGRVGLFKLTAILENSPATAVTVVAPSLLPEFHELAHQHPQVQLHARPYCETDLSGHDVVFIATNDAALNRHIKAAAKARQLLANVTNAPEECDFFLPSVVQQGELKVAISSNGRPGVGRRLRERLEETLPTLVQPLADLGTRLKENVNQQLYTFNAGPQATHYGPAYESAATTYWRRVATAALATFALFVFLNILSYYVTWQQAWHFLRNEGTFYTFVGVGFVAQLIDGMLGMGYGVVSAISLMSLGLSPVSVSASIHTAEMFASGASGYQHYRFGNVNKKLFRVLLLPGILGSVSGALLLTYFGEQYANYIKPLLAVYLLILGLRIISKALRKQQEKRRQVKNAGWLAGAGGFLDSFGGGGWGPLVTSTLITNGRTPRYVIGTVSLVEFFVTFASALTFFSVLGISHWQIVAGLIVGGVAAAPIAARLAGKLPIRWMFIGVGSMVIVWSLWALRKVGGLF